MIKYIDKYALFLMVAFCTSCGQNQTEVKKNSINSVPRDSITTVAPNGMVRNVRQDRNGNILIASYGDVFRYDARLNDKVGQGKSFTNLTRTISSPSFWDVLEDRKGNLWFGTRDSGVYFYNGKSLPTGQARFQHFTTKDGLGSNSALHIYEDRAGNIWFGTAGGASRYDGKSFRNFTTKDGLPNNDINTILEDKTGKLWFGTRGESCFYDGKTFTVPKNKDGKPFTNVWSIIEDRKGNIWFGATIIEDKKGSTFYVSIGLWRYDGSTFTKVSQRGASAIIEDSKGNIWTTGTVEVNGDWALSRYDEKSLYNTKPDVTEIMSVDKMLCGILEAKDGSIWFGSLHGVYRYDGKTITDFKSKEGCSKFLPRRVSPSHALCVERTRWKVTVH